ncbi:MAG: Flp pilus assembly complex ATPase component TadA [Synechococcaceae cyanobacterium RL_1_2]|nr:Flp pilus assembly complex ATPase component TadA [Synechococcaceae cyanobacterium RL_1_2]
MVSKILPETIQTQIHGIANLNLYQLLEAVIVQNPDIIMVEDLKEPGLAVRAIEASLEGHLVISSLDTHDTISAIPRLKKLGVTRDLMMDGLIGIINQRLVRKICPYCSEPYRPQNKELALLGLRRGSLQTTGWRRGKGCIKCLDSGYLGQELIVEVLNVDDGVREMLYQDCLLKLHQHLENITYFSFRVAAIAKINSGVTTTEEIARILPFNMIGGKSRQEYQNKIAQQVTQIRASSRPSPQTPSSDLGPLLDDFNW